MEKNDVVKKGATLVLACVVTFIRLQDGGLLAEGYENGVLTHWSIVGWEKVNGPKSLQGFLSFLKIRYLPALPMGMYPLPKLQTPK